MKTSPIVAAEVTLYGAEKRNLPPNLRMNHSFVTSAAKIKWYDQTRSKGTNLPGTTHLVLTLAHLAANQAGEYQVVVTRLAGTAASQPSSSPNRPVHCGRGSKAGFNVETELLRLRLSVKFQGRVSYF
jgi:hypothetical protein